MTDTPKTLIRDYTHGPLLKQLIVFALPFMAANAMQLLYSVVDMIVVGHVIGKGGLGAVTVSSKTFAFLTMVCAGTSQGGQVLLSQLVGSGRRDRLNGAIGTMFTFLMSVGVVVMIGGLLLDKWILHCMNVPEDIFDDALAYTRVCIWGILFAYGYNISSAVMRGLGDSRHPFIFILIASVINLILDVVFVAWFKWGVMGAGLATILGQAFSFLYALWFLYQHRKEIGFDFTWSSLRIRWDCLRSLLILGLPLACRFSIINLSMLFVMGMVATAGDTALSTFGVGIQLDDISNKISLGVMMSTTGIVAQNYGARNFARIRKAIVYTLCISLIFYVLFAGALWFFTERMFGIFTHDEDVLQLSHVFVRAVIWTFPALLLMKGTNGLIHGIGNSTLGMIFSFLDGCVLRIGLSWFLGTYCSLGFYGYVLGYGISPWGSALPGLFYMLFAPWEKRKLAME